MNVDPANSNWSRGSSGSPTSMPNSCVLGAVDAVGDDALEHNKDKEVAVDLSHEASSDSGPMSLVVQQVMKQSEQSGASPVELIAAAMRGQAAASASGDESDESGSESFIVHDPTQIHEDDDEHLVDARRFLNSQAIPRWQSFSSGSPPPVGSHASALSPTSSRQEIDAPITNSPGPLPNNAGSVRWTVDLRLVPCQICGASSSGYHFGVISCEGCKGFFRRTMTHNLEQTYTCFNAQSTGIRCRIQALGRKCKKCRFDLCQEMGMTTEGGKTGRHSYLRRIQTHRHVEMLRAENRLLSAPLLRFRRRQKPKVPPVGGDAAGGSGAVVVNKAVSGAPPASAFYSTAIKMERHPQPPHGVAHPAPFQQDQREPVGDMWRQMAASAGAMFPGNAVKRKPAAAVYDSMSGINCTNNGSASSTHQEFDATGPMNLKQRVSPGARSSGSSSPPEGGANLPPRKRMMNSYSMEHPQQPAFPSAFESALNGMQDEQPTSANNRTKTPEAKRPNNNNNMHSNEAMSAADFFSLGRAGADQAIDKLTIANRMLMTMAMLKHGGEQRDQQTAPTNWPTPGGRDSEDPADFAFPTLRAIFGGQRQPAEQLPKFPSIDRDHATSAKSTAPTSTNKLPPQSTDAPAPRSPQTPPASLTSPGPPPTLANLAWLFDCARARFNLTGLALTSELQNPSGPQNEHQKQQTDEEPFSSTMMTASSPYCWPSVCQTDGAASTFVMAARCEWLVASVVRHAKVLESLSSQGRHLITPGMSVDQVWAALMKYFEENSNQLLQFVRSLFGHQHLHFADRTLLFVESAFPLFFAQMALDPVEAQRLGLQTSGVCREVIIKYLTSAPSSSTSSTSSSASSSPTSNVKTARMTIAEFSIMCGLLFFNSDTPGLTEPSRVEAVAAEYRRALEMFVRRTTSPAEAAEARIAQLYSHLKHFCDSPNLFCWLMRNAGASGVSAAPFGASTPTASDRGGSNSTPPVAPKQLSPKLAPDNMSQFLSLPPESMPDPRSAPASLLFSVPPRQSQQFHQQNAPSPTSSSPRSTHHVDQPQFMAQMMAQLSFPSLMARFQQHQNQQQQQQQQQQQTSHHRQMQPTASPQNSLRNAGMLAPPRDQPPSLR